MSRQTRSAIGVARGALFGSAPAGVLERLGAQRLAFLVLSLALVSGCSSTDEFLNSQPPPPGGSPPSAVDRFRSLFGSSPSGATAQAQSPSPGSAEVACPPVDIRRGAATLQTTTPGNDQAMAVRYQATFVRTARQCTVNADTLSIKVGVQGRVILGPAGAPGDAMVPLRVALVQEGIEPKSIWSKLYNIPVSVPPGQPNVPFTYVVEDLAIPLPPSSELDRYVIYVGFDPQGAVQDKSKEKKPQRARQPRPG
jgi:hypothetical protein